MVMKPCTELIFIGCVYCAIMCQFPGDCVTNPVASSSSSTTNPPSRSLTTNSTTNPSASSSITNPTVPASTSAVPVVSASASLSTVTQNSTNAANGILKTTSFGTSSEIPVTEAVALTTTGNSTSSETSVTEAVNITTGNITNITTGNITSSEISNIATTGKTTSKETSASDKNINNAIASLTVIGGSLILIGLASLSSKLDKPSKKIDTKTTDVNAVMRGGRVQFRSGIDIPRIEVSDNTEVKTVDGVAHTGL